MPRYRLVVLDPNGRAKSAFELDCPDDETAVDMAAHLRHQHGLEVWDQERRLIAHFARAPVDSPQRRRPL
jgi:hypothetical protein